MSSLTMDLDHDIVQVFTGLADGTHIFIVRDSLGCIDTTIVEIIHLIQYLRIAGWLLLPIVMEILMV